MPPPPPSHQFILEICRIYRGNMTVISICFLCVYNVGLGSFMEYFSKSFSWRKSFCVHKYLPQEIPPYPSYKYSGSHSNCVDVIKDHKERWHTMEFLTLNIHIHINTHTWRVYFIYIIFLMARDGMPKRIPT